MNGIYTLSVRRGDRDAMRAAAYAHVGLAVDGIDLDHAVLASAFTDAGFTVADLTGYIDGIHGLSTDPEQVPGFRLHAFGERGGIDSEGRRTDLFMVSTGEEPEATDWLDCAETADTVWPRLLNTLGASISGHIFEPATEADDDDHPGFRSFRLPESGFRVPKSIRLKSGWDYDAEGHQIWLPIEEAWRRFAAHNKNRDGNGEDHMGVKMMRKMRKHMEESYKGHATTKAKREHDERASA